MRENKFRVYCEFEFDGELHKSMESSASWFLLTQTGKLWTYEPGEAPRPLGKEYKKAIPLFYTGLKDKNGKRIYEGDVIYFRTSQTQHFKGTIKWGDARFYAEVYWQKQDAIGDLAKDHEHHWLEGNYQDYRFSSDLFDIEIIGNIYENPELLKENK